MPKYPRLPDLLPKPDGRWAEARSWLSFFGKGNQAEWSGAVVNPLSFREADVHNLAEFLFRNGDSYYMDRYMSGEHWSRGAVLVSRNPSATERLDLSGLTPRIIYGLLRKRLYRSRKDNRRVLLDRSREGLTFTSLGDLHSLGVLVSSTGLLCETVLREFHAHDMSRGYEPLPVAQSMLDSLAEMEGGVISRAPQERDRIVESANSEVGEFLRRATDLLERVDEAKLKAGREEEDREQERIADEAVARSAERRERLQTEA